MLPIDLQTLEIDADGFGAVDVFAENLRVYPRAGRAYAPENNLFGSRKNAVFSMLFAIYSVFRIFSGNELLDDASILGADHPPAVYRQRFILATLLQYIMEHSIISPPELANVVSLAIVEAEQAFAILTGSSALKAQQITESFERSNKLLDQLSANWKNLRPQVDLLKRGGELPR